MKFVSNFNILRSIGKPSFFTIVIYFFLSTNSLNAQNCSSYEATQLVERYEGRILSKLESSGDKNVYTEVLRCKYYSQEDVWVIFHYISFRGFWTDNFYEATGKLTVKPNSWDWRYVDLNDNLENYLFTLGLLKVLAEEAIEYSSSPNANIEKVWVDYNVYDNGKKGMRIHSKITINNAQHQDCQVVAYFYFNDGRIIKGYNGKYEAKNSQVCVWKNINPGYENTVYNDLIMFIPIDELELSSRENDLYFEVKVFIKNEWKYLGKANKVYFTTN